MLDIYGGNDISVNDFEAYDKYINYNYLYNKLFIARSQGLKCGTKKDNVDKLPVIVRPIINLVGMGKNSKTVCRYKDISIPKDCFWCEFLTGKHLSYDIFINDHGIQDYIIFRGYPTEKGMFDKWKYIKNKKLPYKLIIWINKYLKNYNGVINLETIGEFIIECHLRMGDMNLFQREDITKNIIDCYNNLKINPLKLPTIYLVPVFVPKGKFVKVTKSMLIKAINSDKKNWKSIVTYMRDNKSESNPVGGDRLCMIVVYNLYVGLKIRKILLNMIFRKHKN